MNPLVRSVLPGIVADTFELDDVEIEGDRFAGFGSDLTGARAAYEAEQPVRVVFESGAGADEPGEQRGTFELDFDEWPPPAAQVRTWYLAPGGRLSDTAPRATRQVDTFRFDPEAGATDLFPGGGYPLFDPTWSEAVWSQFADGDVLSYLTDPFGDDVVFAGPGAAELWVASDVRGAPVMVTVSEVRPDGTEFLVQNGVVRLGFRVDARRTDGLEVAHDFSSTGFRPARAGQFDRAVVEIPAFNQVVRAGSQLRVTISTPGRNFAAWAFDNPNPGGGEPVQRVGRDPGRPSAVRLTVLPGIDVPDVAAPACPSLRGQVCRPYEPRANHTAPA
jgi:hypothetical protein